LTRSRQGRFVIEPVEDGDRTCVPWEIFQKATAAEADEDGDGWTEWEREVMECLEVV